MNNRKATDRMVDELFDILASLETPDDYRTFFKDVCTDKEIDQMAQRVRAAKMLLDGNTYSQTMEETDISSATLSRVSKCVQYGEGYRRFVKYNKKEV